MIFRRIKAHVAKEDWFAVFIDFIIVVFGVGMALLAQQWLQGAQQRSNLANAEIALRADLYSNYFNAKERLSFADCRKVRTRELADRLMSPEDQWTGMPWIGYENGTGGLLPSVLPSTYRSWGSRIWEAELRKGTFDSMNAERRQLFDEMFSQAKIMAGLQTDIYDTQARLKVLALTADMTSSDRARYYELLALHDEKSGLLELASQQKIDQIEAIGLADDEALHAEYRDFVARINSILTTRMGECFAPIVMPFIEKGDAEVNQP